MGGTTLLARPGTQIHSVIFAAMNHVRKALVVMSWALQLRLRYVAFIAANKLRPIFPGPETK